MTRHHDVIKDTPSLEGSRIPSLQWFIPFIYGLLKSLSALTAAPCLTVGPVVNDPSFAGLDEKYQEKIERDLEESLFEMDDSAPSLEGGLYES